MHPHTNGTIASLQTSAFQRSGKVSGVLFDAQPVEATTCLESYDVRGPSRFRSRRRPVRRSICLSDLPPGRRPTPKSHRDFRGSNFPPQPRHRPALRQSSGVTRRRWPRPRELQSYRARRAAAEGRETKSLPRCCQRRARSLWSEPNIDSTRIFDFVPGFCFRDSEFTITDDRRTIL